MGDYVEIIGLAKAVGLVNPSHYAQGFRTGLFRAGQEAEGQMKQAARSHRDTGNLEQQIHTSEPVGSGLNLEVHVGIATGLAPEGRPIAFGWRSSSGKMPPVAPIAEWIQRRGGMGATASVTRTKAGFIRRKGTVAQISSEPAIRSLAFAIARSIQKRGYRFGSDDWFHRGIDAARPRLAEIVRSYMRRTP